MIVIIIVMMKIYSVPWHSLKAHGMHFDTLITISLSGESINCVKYYVINRYVIEPYMHWPWSNELILMDEIYNVILLSLIFVSHILERGGIFDCFLIFVSHIWRKRGYSQLLWGKFLSFSSLPLTIPFQNDVITLAQHENIRKWGLESQMGITEILKYDYINALFAFQSHLLHECPFCCKLTFCLSPFFRFCGNIWDVCS